MTLLPNNENFAASSGLIDVPFMENLYHSIIDEMFIDLGRTVVFHLEPEIQQDTTTQQQAAPQQYNPFFRRTAVPNHTTRSPGVRISTREVQYEAQIKVGPMIAGNDDTGMGDIAENEAVITVVIEALQHVREALSVSIEGRRYSVEETRPIGFSKRLYLMVKLAEIQESEARTPDDTIG